MYVGRFVQMGHDKRNGTGPPDVCAGDWQLASTDEWHRRVLLSG